MGHTRKDNYKPAKISADELLALIERCDKQGFPMYVSAAIDCADRKTVCGLFDSGQITYQRSDYGRSVQMGDIVHLAKQE